MTKLTNEQIEQREIRKLESVIDNPRSRELKPKSESEACKYDY